MSCLLLTQAQTSEHLAVIIVNAKPALITTMELANFNELPLDRRVLIETAIAVKKNSPYLPYTPQGASPTDGGFDCSGAMYYVLRKAGLHPPRTASDQFLWLKKNDRLHLVFADGITLDHPNFQTLRPGDLLFWGKMNSMKINEKFIITHVAMFLGFENKDKHPVMINSTDGRSYRGIKANGYGVYDFRLPLAHARIAFIGYGTPPGISIIQEQQELPDNAENANSSL